MADEKTINAYNKGAREYHEDNKGNPMLASVIEKFVSRLPGKRVVEFGCGTGRDAVRLIESGCEYTGIDASQGMIDFARETTDGRGTFIKMDLSELDFPNTSFDGFWAAASLLHIAKEKIDDVLRSMYRCLKTGAVGFISLKKKDGIEEGYIHQEKWGGIDRYFAFYDREEFTAHLSTTGFTCLEQWDMVEDDGTHWLAFLVTKHES